MPRQGLQNRQDRQQDLDHRKHGRLADRTSLLDTSSCYDNNHANCESTGRLYTWNAANNNLCPTGWTLPTLEDYKAAFADKNADALKDAAGFNLQFAGFKYYDGKFADKDASASFWTSDKYDDSRAYLARVTNTRTTFEHYNKNIFASVRCIKK